MSQHPTPAATVVLVREGMQRPEVLLLKRNENLVFNGGCWVFPGGRIDPEDYLEAGSSMEYPAACRAAVRETREEAGILIREDHLIHTAHWTTPENLPRRFSTWFFVCPLSGPVDVQVDRGEILAHRWITPAAALAEQASGALEIPHPTRVTLADLRDFSTLPELLAAMRSSQVRVFPPRSPFYRPFEMGFSRS